MEYIQHKCSRIGPYLGGVQLQTIVGHPHLDLDLYFQQLFVPYELKNVIMLKIA